MVGNSDLAIARRLQEQSDRIEELKTELEIQQSAYDIVLDELRKTVAKLAQVVELEPESHYVNGFCTHRCVPEQAIHEALEKADAG